MPRKKQRKTKNSRTDVLEEIIALYHLRDWYGTEIKSETKTQKGHTVICEPGSNKCTMRKPRLPPARSLEITECKPHGQHLTDSWTQASNDAVMWQMEVEQEKTDLR